MNDFIRSVIAYAFIVAFIITGFYMYKIQNKVVIDPNDHTMDSDYKYGDYKLDVSLTKISDLKCGDAVAYWVPGSGKERVAWVVALEGQKIDYNKNIKVDGQMVKWPGSTRPETWFSGMRVPRGCAYLVVNQANMAEDSLTVGPVPFTNIKGRLYPPN